MAGWRKLHEADQFLEVQPIELQGLVTECLLATDNDAEAMSMFLEKRDEFVARREETGELV